MTFLLLFTISCLLIPTVVQAQATRTLPLGRDLGINTHIPVQGNMSAVNTRIDRQIERAQEQARQAELERQQRLRAQGLRLEEEDIWSEKGYVVTPEGNIPKHSWQACQYYYHWVEKQNSYHLTPEQIRSQQEAVLFQLDLTEEHCYILAQKHRLPAASGVSVVPQFDVATLLQPDIRPITEQPACGASTTALCEESFSWREVAHMEYIPRPISKRKAKRYLKEFLEENKDDLERALALQNRQERLNPGLRRLLSSYDSLCAQYERSVGEPSPDCRLSF